MYEIKIVKRVKNLDWKPEERIDPYYPNRPMPSEYIEERYLETVVTDEEFKAIKKAVLEII